MRASKSCAIVAALLLSLGLWGCANNTTDNVASSDSAQQEAEASSTPEETPAPEEPTVDISALEKQVEGPWEVTACNVDGQSIPEADMQRLKTQGAFYYGTFGSDKVFTLYSHTTGKDKELWQGTWSVDETGALNLTLDNGIPFTVASITDNIILTTPDNVQTENGAWKLGLKKLTDKELKTALKAANKISPYLKLGKKVSTEDFSFKLTSAKVVDEIYPPDTSGYYIYYEKQSGKKYFLVRGTFKNKSSSYADLKYATSATFVINDGKYELQGTVEGCRSDSSNFVDYQVDPLDSVELYIFCEISDEMVDKMKSAELVWKFAPELNVYFDEANVGHTYTTKLK
ncbi:MAG: hypothetical protein UCH28_07345 [Adlercreutzia sp.]|nr:hypothetical protein [Adlercreutzia sp.]